MTKQEKLQKIENQIIEKFGQKIFTRTSIVAVERFGQKTDLKIKFFQSIMEGYINPDELWTSDENIQALQSKIEKATGSKKEEIILEILDTYNPKDPKIKLLLRRYSDILEKQIKPEKITIN